MSNNNFFDPESLLEQGVSVIKKTGNVAAQQVKATAQTVTSQITGNNTGSSGADSGAADPDSIGADSSVPDAAAAAQTKDFVQELYGIKKSSPQQSSTSPAGATSTSHHASQPAGDNQAKLAATRQQLEQLKQQQHTREYYDPTFNSPKPPEEKPVEKLEREKQEEEFEFQKKKAEKPQDIAAQRANQRTEKFPGASG